MKPKFLSHSFKIVHLHHKDRRSDLLSIIPNAITILALCLGVTSIRFALQGQFEWSVILIVLATFLDVLDGRLARLFDVQSKMGSTLDTLADFINFGFATVILVYLWQGYSMHQMGWIYVLLHTVCAALRLARFNVTDEVLGESHWKNAFFIGIPTPAAAGLTMLPIILEAYGFTQIREYPVLIGCYVMVISCMMISNIPTFSTKTLSFTVSKKYMKFILLSIGVLASFILIYMWLTLIVMGIMYVASIPFSIWYYRKLRKSEYRDSSE